MSASNRDDGGARKAPETTSALEWLVAALGGLLVLFAVGYMVQFAVTHPEGPPEVRLEVTSIAPSGEGYLVSFKATNTGRSTGAGLIIEGALTLGGETMETSEATIDFLPQESERLGGLFFTENPADHEMELRALGYAEP
ncbi:MAG: hypothetical protein Q7S93_17205 [Phenylobacterium sp.]|uniref:hypothetical protein n=1 Tax=Phenylobacterium sp. TaxID=1871053 RepID=UPI00271D682B|nr:hypothetical protein [Phenylobacterium sp.]MDO8411794.1 hypothetical protein [Phenylobacterium sp.]